MNTSGCFESKENLKPVRTKLYVSNFPANSTRRSLTEFFSKFGQVLECAIMWDKYAFIHYGTMEEAQNAVRKASSMYFMGQKLFIQLSTSKNRQNNNWYQQEAEKMLAKANDLSLSSSSGNLIETKLYVTNLPENCDQQELKQLFEKYGDVLECVIMWNHYAFIHFSDFNEAKIALDNLHGTIFNGKRLLVQLSTSSNRPLPKCLAFSKKKSKNDSSILCYRANDNEEKNESCNESKLENDWIEKLKNGCVPVVPSPNADKKFDVSKFFSSFNNQENKLNLSTLPTPDVPDIPIKTPKTQIEKDVTFDLIPTPPIPIPGVSETIKQESDCLKKLIDEINTSISYDEFNYIDENKNEKILIDRLNMLKYDLDQDSRLRSLWNGTDSDACSSAAVLSSSSGVSTSSSVRSLSPPYTPFSIDYLNKNCVYEENLLKSQENDRHLNRVQQQQQKKSRCRLVNYLLFPEVKEENFQIKTDYNNILIELIKKNCIID